MLLKASAFEKANQDQKQKYRGWFDLKTKNFGTFCNKGENEGTAVNIPRLQAEKVFRETLHDENVDPKENEKHLKANDKLNRL